MRNPLYYIASTLTTRAFATRHLLSIPSNESWVFLLHEPLEVPQFSANWFAGMSTVGERIKDSMQGMRRATGRVRVWAKQGENWPKQDRFIFENFLKPHGVTVSRV
jgi:hypothetical protein